MTTFQSPAARWLPHALLALGLLASRPAHAQRRSVAMQGTSALEGTIEHGSERYTVKVRGECSFDPRAKAGSPRVQWNVYVFNPARYADVHQFALAIWQGDEPNRSAELSFNLSVGQHGVAITTFHGREREGSGTVTVERLGAGARFHLVGRDGAGRVVRADIVCDRVSSPAATGG